MKFCAAILPMVAVVLGVAAIYGEDATIKVNCLVKKFLESLRFVSPVFIYPW
jgi:hypothetical protein